MSQGLRSIAADVDDLARLIRTDPPNDRRYQVEEWLRQRYDDVYREGHEDGRYSALAGNGAKPTRGPYAR